MPIPKLNPQSDAIVVPFSRDRLSLVARDAAATAAFAQLHAVQDERPELAMAGTAILFFAFCHRLGVDPEEMWRLGGKLLKPQPGHKLANAQMEGLIDFAKLRMQGREV